MNIGLQNVDDLFQNYLKKIILFLFGKNVNLEERTYKSMNHLLSQHQSTSLPLCTDTDTR